MHWFSRRSTNLAHQTRHGTRQRWPRSKIQQDSRNLGGVVGVWVVTVFESHNGVPSREICSETVCSMAVPYSITLGETSSCIRFWASRPTLDITPTHTLKSNPISLLQLVRLVSPSLRIGPAPFARGSRRARPGRGQSASCRRCSVAASASPPPSVPKLAPCARHLVASPLLLHD